MQQTALFAAESLIGPPSELISVAEFIQSCSVLAAEFDDTNEPDSDGDSDMLAVEECRYVQTQRRESSVNFMPL